MASWSFSFFLIAAVSQTGRGDGRLSGGVQLAHSREAGEDASLLFNSRLIRVKLM